MNPKDLVEYMDQLIVDPSCLDLTCAYDFQGVGHVRPYTPTPFQSAAGVAEVLRRSRRTP